MDQDKVEIYRPDQTMVVLKTLILPYLNNKRYIHTTLLNMVRGCMPNLPPAFKTNLLNI